MEWRSDVPLPGAATRMLRLWTAPIVCVLVQRALRPAAQRRSACEARLHPSPGCAVQVRAQLAGAKPKDRSSPYGTPKGLRSPLASPLVTDPQQARRAHRTHPWACPLRMQCRPWQSFCWLVVSGPGRQSCSR